MPHCENLLGFTVVKNEAKKKKISRKRQNFCVGWLSVTGDTDWVVGIGRDSSKKIPPNLIVGLSSEIISHQFRQVSKTAPPQGA